MRISPPSIIITLPCRHPLASFFVFFSPAVLSIVYLMKCFFSFFFILPPLLSLKQRWVVLNFSSVRFSSVFVCRTESRVVVGSLSSQISPEWRLCVHYYIYLSFSLWSPFASPGWLTVYTVRVSYRCFTSCTLDCIHPRPVVNYRSPIVFFLISTFSSLLLFRQLLCLFISFRCATSESYPPFK